MEVMDTASDETNEKGSPENPGEEDGSLVIESENEEDNEGEEVEDDDDEEDAEEAEVKILEAALTENPYDYTSHVAIISKLQRMGELERLRTARENMSAKYPLSPELWLSWMRDEIKLATTPEQKAEVVKLCERAIKDYLSVEVWLEYLQFSIGNMGSEKDAAKNVRQLFERALTAAGLHTIKGAIIWEAFREFETILYALIDPSNQAEKNEQLERIGNLFRRQLACPLLDMEKTREEYDVWRTKGDGVEATIDNKIIIGGYERAVKQLNDRLPYEEKIVSSQGEHELLDSYKGYLLHEKQNGDPGRITVLYERGITDLSLETSIWIDYLTYLEQNIKIQSVLNQVYERASRNVSWCAVVWQKWIRSYEKWEKPVLEVQSLLENALATGFSNAEEYRNLWLTYLQYLRRRIDQSSNDEKKQLEVLRNTFNRACEHLAKAFGLEGDPNCVLLQFWARTEAIHASDMETARSLWSDILSQGHSVTASYWLEYISLERCYGDTKHLRKLYQKALSSVKDWPESIANAWIDFERDEGTLEQMELCEAKTKEKLDRTAEERQKAQQLSSHHELPPSQNKKAHKRKPDDSGRWKNLAGSPSKMTKLDVQIKPKLKESRLNPENKIDNVSVEQKPKVAPPPGFKPSEEDNKMDVDTHEVDDKITVFVSNLDYTATEEEVRNALEPAGPITLLKMIRDYKGRSKGYCYVQLNSTSAVEEALKLDRVPIRGRPMFVSRCDPDKTTRTTVFKYSSSLEKNKLFIKGLSVNTTKEKLEEAFKAHGALKEIRIVTYRNGHSKGLAYVEYEDEITAGKALLATDGITLDEKVISVAISQPPQRKHVSTMENTIQIKSLGGTTVTRSSFGMPRTLLSMIPRTVKTTTSANGNANVTGSGVAPKMSNQDFRNMLLNKK